MLRIGLTGGIACGKSHVLARLASRGLPVLDLDRVAHEVIAKGGTAHDDVVSAFGPVILLPDESIDRKRLGAIVFADESARDRLNAIIHPRVRAEERRQAAALEADVGAVLVTDAALLVEAGLHLRFDRLVVVHCTPEEQLRRLMARDGLPEPAARARLAAQMPIGEKRRFAHREVDTSGSVVGTNDAADRLGDELLTLARAPRRRVALSIERAAGVIANGPERGPRGLDPARLVGEIASAGGLEMERVARLLAPPASPPWYRAARAGEGEPGPETLAGPLVLFALGRAGDDPDFVAAAAASLARLTHVEPQRVAGACHAALVLHQALLGETDEAAPRADLQTLAERWGGAPVPSGVRGALRASLPRMLEPAADVPEHLEENLARLSRASGSSAGMR